jgi:hypothetical protein
VPPPDFAYAGSIRRVRACLAGIALVLTAAVQADGAAPHVSHYGRVVALVVKGDAAARGVFAEEAIAALVAAYRAETGKAAKGKRPGWQNGAYAFIADLERTASHVPDARRIDVLYESHGVVRVIVDDEQVIVTAPRLSRQQNLESEIAARVCDRIGCETGTPSIEEQVAANAPEIKHEWSFEDKAPPAYQSSDGLECVFPDPRHLKLKKAACDALTRELRLLAEALKALLARGVAVDWGNLMVGHGADGDVRKVVYDRSGHYFQLDLPYLRHAPNVWLDGIPWLQSYARGHALGYVVALDDRLVYASDLPHNSPPP